VVEGAVAWWWSSFCDDIVMIYLHINAGRFFYVVVLLSIDNLQLTDSTAAMPH
jgi:hypothetical protein